MTIEYENIAVRLGGKDILTACRDLPADQVI